MKQSFDRTDANEKENDSLKESIHALWPVNLNQLLQLKPSQPITGLRLHVAMLPLLTTTLQRRKRAPATKQVSPTAWQRFNALWRQSNRVITATSSSTCLPVCVLPADDVPPSTGWPPLSRAQSAVDCLKPIRRWQHGVTGTGRRRCWPQMRCGRHHAVKTRITRMPRDQRSLRCPMPEGRMRLRSVCWIISLASSICFHRISVVSLF